MKEQEVISAQQELKHLRTRCGKVYALGNNRFRAVVQTTPVHEYDAATHQWVELSAEKRQQMAAQAHSPIATFSDSANSAENAAGILDTYVKEGSTQNFSNDERLWISNTNYYGNRLTYLKGRGFAASGRQPLHHGCKAVHSQRLRADGGHRHHVQGSAGGLESGDDYLRDAAQSQRRVSGLLPCAEKSVFVERVRCHEPCAQVVFGRQSRRSAECARQ